MESQAARGAVKAAAFAFGTVSLLVHKATQDGHLAAAGRQGIDELGAALKAFPDAIQTQEPGTIFNPTQGEVAADRKAGGYGQHSPSGIVGGKHGVYGPEHERPQHGQSAGRTPSELAADRGGVQGPEHGQDHGHDHSRGM
jgi:hypothetical protein